MVLYSVILLSVITVIMSYCHNYKNIRVKVVTLPKNKLSQLKGMLVTLVTHDTYDTYLDEQLQATLEGITVLMTVVTLSCLGV